MRERGAYLLELGSFMLLSRVGSPGKGDLDSAGYWPVLQRWAQFCFVVFKTSNLNILGISQLVIYLKVRFLFFTFSTKPVYFRVPEAFWM